MKKLFSILLMVIYCLSSTGATVYYHKCAEYLSLSFLQDKKVSHDNCPLCKVHHHVGEYQHTYYPDCANNDNSCQDVQLDIEKTTTEVVQANNANVIQYLVPFEFILHWISNSTFQEITIFESKNNLKSYLSIKHNPPDLYLLNNIFRI